MEDCSKYTFLEVFFFLRSISSIFLTICEKFCESKSWMSTQFSLSSEIHDDVLLDSSSHKYLHFVVQIFIHIFASIFYIWHWMMSESINIKYCKYLYLYIEIFIPIGQLLLLKEGWRGDNWRILMRWYGVPTILLEKGWRGDDWRTEKVMIITSYTSKY